VKNVKHVKHVTFVVANGRQQEKLIYYKPIGAAPGGIFLLGGEGAFGQKSL
jgi:hypothetical protein